MVNTLRCIDMSISQIYETAINLNDRLGDITENVRAIKTCEKINAVANL